MSGVLAVVPAKPLAEALGRLEGALSGPERRRLQEAMLADVLGAVRAAPGLVGALVVTGDPGAATLARAGGAGVVAEPAPPGGMNAAVAAGLRAAADVGARAALILTGDLPLLAPVDLAALLAAAPPGPGVVLAPSRDGTGTNALLLTPPEILTPALGPGSLARHRAQAERRGIVLALCSRPGLGLDVDTPADLEALRRAGASGATGAALRALSPPLCVGGGR